MDVQEEYCNEILMLSLSGRLDNAAAQEFVKVITHYIESGELKILINCADLVYLSSSGLRVFLGAAKRMQKKEGVLVWCALQGIVWRVVEIAGFHKILAIYNTKEEALEHF